MTTTSSRRTSTNWRIAAACRFLAPADGETGPHWWYPEKGAGNDNHGALAKAVCRACPVREQCLMTALEANEEHGIHGGAGEQRRRTLRRAQAAGVLEAALAAHWRALDGVPVAGDRKVLAGFGAGAQHGRPGTYAKGCRCDPCALAVGMREVQASLRSRRPASGGRAA